MRFLSTLVCLFLFVGAGAQEHYLLVGTYASPLSKGIHVYRFNSTSGQLTQVSEISTPNPSFLTISSDGKYVYAVHETAPASGKGGEIASFSFDKKTGTLTPINNQPSGGDHPCHVELDKTNRWLFAANYASGSISVFPVNEDGSLGPASVIQHKGSGPNPRQKGPHAHGNRISPDNKYLLNTDLGIDKVSVYDFDAATGKLIMNDDASANSKPGSGPRLLTFHPNNKFVYVVEELTGTVAAYSFKKGKLKEIQRVSTIAKGDTGFAASADVQVTPDGEFLFASNRGEMNNIAAYHINQSNGKLTAYSYSPVGRTPRNFTVDPSGKFVLVGCQGSDEIMILRRDHKVGILINSGSIQIGKPVCLRWVAIE
jgi:6-phosphogluconolactonase